MTVSCFRALDFFFGAALSAVATGVEPAFTDRSCSTRQAADVMVTGIAESNAAAAITRTPRPLNSQIEKLHFINNIAGGGFKLIGYNLTYGNPDCHIIINITPGLCEEESLTSNRYVGNSVINCH